MRLPTPKVQRCVLCGSTRKVEMNHAGGKHFVAWFTMPFCYEHHARFHILVQQAGVDLEYTSNPIERYQRAMSAIKICEWMILEAMKKEIQKEKEKKPHAAHLQSNAYCRVRAGCGDVKRASGGVSPTCSFARALRASKRQEREVQK